jgi:hypothetical protein
MAAAGKSSSNLCEKHLYLCAIHLFVVTETADCNTDVYFALCTNKFKIKVIFDAIFNTLPSFTERYTYMRLGVSADLLHCLHATTFFQLPPTTNDGYDCHDTDCLPSICIKFQPIVLMHHMMPGVLQLVMSCNFSHQSCSVWDTNPDKNFNFLTQPIMLH